MRLTDTCTTTGAAAFSKDGWSFSKIRPTCDIPMHPAWAMTRRAHSLTSDDSLERRLVAQCNKEHARKINAVLTNRLRQ